MTEVRLETERLILRMLREEDFEADTRHLRCHPVDHRAVIGVAFMGQRRAGGNAKKQCGSCGKRRPVLPRALRRGRLQPCPHARVRIPAGRSRGDRVAQGRDQESAHDLGSII